MRYKINFKKLICVLLCAAALIGFMFPALNINIDFFGNSRSVSLGMKSLIDKPGDLLGGLEPDMPSRFAGLDFSDLFDLSDLFDFSGEAFAGIRAKAIISVGAYFLTVFLIILSLVLIISGKSKKTGAVLSTVFIISVISVILFIYAGYTVLTIPEPLIEIIGSALESSLGFFAMFINFSDLLSNILTLRLGFGYWLTLAALCAALIFNLIFFIKTLFANTRRRNPE